MLKLHRESAQGACRCNSCSLAILSSAWPTKTTVPNACGPGIQVAAAAALCGRHEEALQYVELWSASITRSARLPAPAECAVHYAAARAGGDIAGYVAACGGGEGGLGGADLGLRPEEAVLWAAYRAIGDADLAHGMSRAPKV